jgi:hypothetical protein
MLANWVCFELAGLNASLFPLPRLRRFHAPNLMHKEVCVHLNAVPCPERPFERDPLKGSVSCILKVSVDPKQVRYTARTKISKSAT